MPYHRLSALSLFGVSLVPVVGTSLLFGGCVDYRIQVSDNNTGPDDGIPVTQQEYLSGLPHEDICADLWAPPTTEIPINEDCSVEPSSGPLDAVVEWRIEQYTSYREYSQAVMTPLVGSLSDDNGDGRIDRQDVPDIILITDDDGAASSEHGVLRILSGDGAGELRSVNRTDYKSGENAAQIYPYRYANAALGDIDLASDGLPEIVTIVRVVGGEIIPPDTSVLDTGNVDETGKPGKKETGSPGGGEGGGGDDQIRPPPPEGTTLGGEGCMLAAYHADLSLAWISADVDLPCGGHAPAIADLEGDGQPEVVLGPYIFSGQTGHLKAQGAGDVGRFRAYAEMGLHSIVSDLDGDGISEVIAGRSLYAPDGSRICQGSTGFDGFTAAADLDLDGQGEFLVVGNGQATLFEADCSVAQNWALPGGGSGGPPTIADYDGDGYPEVGMADATSYTVYEHDGAVLWTVPVTDASSHATGSVVFDFEGDGYPEVVYADEVSLWIYDGRDGAVRYESPLHESRTLHEYPTVADIDGDGSAEIITVNGGSHYGAEVGGLYVYGSASDGWEGGRHLWNQHAYSITNINDDLSVPAVPIPNWPLYNNFRSGDVNPHTAGSAPDAVPVYSLCQEECAYGRVVLQVRVGNQGPVALRAGLQVLVYAEQPSGDLVEIAAAWTTAVALEGQASEVVELDLPVAKLPTGTVLLVVDGNDAVSECSEDNNAIRISGLRCPE